MCTPLMLGALALSGAGTGMQMAAQSKANKAMDAAVGAETSRQAGFNKQKQQQFETTLADFDPNLQHQELAGEQAKRAEVFAADLKNQTPYALPTGGVAPRVVKNEIGSQLAESNRFNAQQGDALAKLGGYSPFQLNNNIRLGRGGQQQNMLSNFAAGSNSVLPLEMMAASRKGDKLKGYGQLTSSIGSLLGLGSAMGYGAGFSNPQNLSTATIPIRTF